MTKEPLEKLAAERSENTSEIFSPNDFYGQAYLLKKYCGINQEISLPGIYPHGISIIDKVWALELQHPLPFLLLKSKLQSAVFSNYCDKSSWIIGSANYYAVRLIQDELKDIQSDAKGTLILPVHSTHHLTNNYDCDDFVGYLKDLPDKFKPITICLGWRDIQLKMHYQYIKHGFECTTAGHMYDKDFLFRLVKILAAHKFAITNDIGTSAFYSAAMDLPVILYRQEIETNPAKSDQQDYLVQESKFMSYLPIVERFIETCINPDDQMIQQQKHIAELILGYEDLKEPDELRDLFESLWQKNQMRPFIKKPNHIAEGTLDEIIDTVSKRVKSFPRRTPGRIKINGRSFTYADLHSFYYQAIQIFKSNLYGFAEDNENPVIIDGGAHTGLASIYFAERYPKGKIYAYEADPAIAKMLDENINTFGLKNVKTFGKAIWINDDGVSFENTNDDSGYISNFKKENCVRIPSIRLKNILKNKKIDLLKLDIEGSEHEVIADCNDVLKNVQHLIIEVHKYRNQNGSLAGILSVLENNKFEYTLGDLHSADWIESRVKPPFDAVRSDKYIITVFAWQKQSRKISSQHLDNKSIEVNYRLASKLKVVHVCTQDSGGAGKAAYRLHKGLQEIGVDSTMLVVNKKSADPSVKVFPSKYLGSLQPCLNVLSHVSPLWSRQIQRWDNEIAKYPNRPPGLEIFTDALADVELEQIQEIKDADIINLHWVAGTLDYPGAPLALRNKKIVWTLHDMNPFTGGCHYAGDCKKYEQNCGACPQLGSNIEDDLSRQIWNQKYYAFQNLALNVVTPSKWLANCVSQGSVLSRFPVKVIPYGFPLDTFEPYPKNEIRRSLNIPVNAKVILFGADSIVNNRKGFVYLLEALKRVPPNKEYATVVLTFGGFPESLRISTEHSILNLGSLADENQVALAYSAADVFVIPSLEDNLPNTVVEAMACGVPVVGFDIGGIPDMIEHKKNGFLAKPMDIASLLEGIEWALCSADGDNNISALCRERAETKFALEVQANAYKELYDSLTPNQELKSEVDCSKQFKDKDQSAEEAASLAPMTANNSPEKLLVSAIVSTYNSEKLIRGCLEDLENQTIAENLEIIVVDSGSQQNEEEIVKEFQARYSNIKYIKTRQRETVYASWNRGIKAATGKYITNANTDDRHSPDAFAIMVRALEENPEIGAVYADTLITDKENETFESNTARQYFNRPNFNLRQMLLFSFFGPQPMWRRSVHQKIGYFDESLLVAADYDFFIRLAREFGALRIGEILGLYARRSGSIENSNRDRCVSETLQILKHYRDTIPLEELYPGLKSEKEPEKAFAACLADQGNCCLFGDIPDLEGALAHYNRSLDHGDTQAEVLANLGVALWLIGNQTKGIEILDRISDRVPAGAHNLAVIEQCMAKGERLSIGRLKVADIHHPVVLAANRGKGLVIEEDRLIPIETVDNYWSGSEMVRNLPCKTGELITDGSRPAFVSVIVRTMNRPILLEECLNSLAVQKFKDFEVIVINDGGKKIDDIIGKYSQRMHILFKEHPSTKGRATALNTGLKSARGKYIAYVDDDDRIYPEHFETLVHELETGDYPVVYSDSFEVTQEADNGTYKTVRKRLVYSRDYDPDLLEKTNYIPILNLMHHRDCVEKVGLFDENLTVLEDWDYWIRLSHHYDFKHIPKITAEYRVRNDYSNATTFESHQFPVCRERIRAKLADSPDKPIKRAEDPLVSIVILTCNQLKYTRKCLASILEHTGPSFEIIVVDNGSVDGTPEFLDSQFEEKFPADRLKVIKNKENKGFAAGNNQGIAAARGEYILLMNNDIVVTPGWLDRLIACAERNPRAGIVGPMSNYVSGPQLVKFVDYNTQTLEGLERFSAKVAEQCDVREQHLLRVVGFCMLIKRAVIDKIGGMDDRYGLGNFEDDDFSLRATIAGFESWIARECFIHHFGHRTFVGEQIDLQKSLLKNWEVFKEKWGLPGEMPYGSPYRLADMKSTQFDPAIHHYPLEKGNSIMEKPSDDFKTAEAAYSAVLDSIHKKRPDKIIEELENFVDAYSKFALAYNDLGVLYYSTGDKEKAFEFYKRAVQLDPENMVFQKNLADFYYVEMGRVGDALRIYVKILEVNPTDVETLLITGHICVALEKFQDAKVFYSRVLEIEPDHPEAVQFLDKLNSIRAVHVEEKTPDGLYEQIQPILNNGDPHKAITSLEQLLNEFPDFALAHNDLGVLYYHMGDKKKTRHHYERAVELMPDNITFKKNLADFYCIELGRIEDALQIYVSILKTNPQDVETLMATGQICVALEKPDDARDFFNQVLEIEPWNENARQEIEKMEKQLSEATINSESAEDAYRRFQTELSNLAPAEAIEALNKIVEIYPDFAIGHNDLGVLYYNAGNEEKALHHYEQAAHLQPQNLTLQKNLADFLFVELKKVEEALQIYVDILATHPDDVETLLIVGHICVALKKFDDAKDFYRRVLALEPDNKDANTNLQILVNGQSRRPLARANTINDETVSNVKNESTDLNTPESEKQFAEPETNVSIVISLDGIQNRVKECLKSIQAYTPKTYELLFVNCGAPKGMLKWVQQLVMDNSNGQIIQCARQAGWAESINQAIQKASGDIIVLMHNDVVVPENWLKAFKMCINLESNTGIVGPMSNRATGIQQMIHSDESDRVDFESASKTFYEQNQYRRVPARKLSDFYLAFRRELPAKIGYFDEQFVSQSVCIEDFCTRAAAKGYRNLVAADTYVYHYDQHPTRKITSKKNPAAEDRKKYQKKWNDAENPEIKAFQMVELAARADELSQKGQFDAAAETVLVGIGARPEDKHLYYALSEISLAAKRFQDAKDALMEMPTTDENQEMRKAELLGYAEEGLANYESAKTCVEEMLAINPNHAQALNLKGILAYRNTDHRSAEQYFKRAIDADPGYGEPYTNLGMLQFEAEQQEEALKFFEKGFRLTPTDLDIATNYHSLISGITEYEKAENLAREASALYPNNQKIKYMLIDFLVQQGKYEMAMPEIEDAILKFGIDDGILGAALKVREKQGPMILKPSNEKATVSCCMIIKDEEKYLARCLNSVKPIVDEIIVVDTGSSDRSINIATAFGARVFEYDWENDFADARNFSISKASGEWILILDGDEVISPLDHTQFRKNVKKIPLAPIAYSITTRNYNKLANIVGWVPNDGLYPDEEAGIGWLPSEKVRLFYGKDQIWFEGAVHELVDPVLKRNGIEIKKCNIPVHHYGRLDKEKLDRKGEIYFDIGQKKLSEMGDDLNALRELAVQATILEKNQEAFELWRRLLAMNPNSNLAAVAYVNMGTIYNRLGKFEDALDASKKAVAHDPDLKEAHYNYAMAELHTGRAQQTVSVLEQLLDGFSEYPPAQFILSTAYLCVGQKEKGLEGIKKLKATPVGAHLDIPFLELAQSLVSARKMEYALCVLGAAIESDITNKEILDLFNECIKMNNESRNMPEIPPTVMKDRQVVKFDNLPQ